MAFVIDNSTHDNYHIHQVHNTHGMEYDITGRLHKELEHLKYYHQRQADFWEWLENEKGLSNEELFNEFEEWEKQQSS